MLDIMAMNKAFYKAMYGDTGRNTDGKKSNPFPECMSISMWKNHCLFHNVKSLM